MPDGRQSSLDNSAINSRVRTPAGFGNESRRQILPTRRRVIDGFLPSIQAQENIPTSEVKVPNKLRLKNVPSGFIKPALPRQTRSVVLARHSVKRRLKKRIRKSTSRRHLATTIIILAAFTFISGAYVTYSGWRTNKRAAAQVEVLAKATEEANSVDELSENEVTTETIYSYEVSDDLPKLIKIPRLQVTSRIKRVGVNAKGELKAPSNVFDAGWYDGSAKPGESGAVLINGHVSGPTKPGIFYRLANLNEGDTIELILGNGKSLTYKVVKLENLNQDTIDMAKVVLPVDPSKQGLNLITHTGRYDVRTNKYENRLLVYAVLN